jgi:hypothetical protein
MWFIFISARRFCAGTAFPSSLAAWTGTWSFRREPPNSTGGTCTHELPHPSRAAAERHVYSQQPSRKSAKLRRSEWRLDRA